MYLCYFIEFMACEIVLIQLKLIFFPFYNKLNYVLFCCKIQHCNLSITHKLWLKRYVIMYYIKWNLNVWCNSMLTEAAVVGAFDREIMIGCN